MITAPAASAVMSLFGPKAMPHEPQKQVQNDRREGKHGDQKLLAGSTRHGYFRVVSRRRFSFLSARYPASMSKALPLTGLNAGEP